MLFLTPSFLIGGDRFVSCPLVLPTHAKPGTFLEVDWGQPRNPNQWLSISNRSFTWRNNHEAFGAVDTKKSVMVVGRVEYQPGGLFRNPNEVLFKHSIKVDLIDLSKSVNLRLPAAVQNRLKNYREDQIQRDQATLEKLTSKVSGPFDFNQCWRPPIHIRITSRFASPRIPPHGQPYYHTGVDLHAPMHTPVKVAANGKVILTSEFPVTGNIVIVDHGGGLYSEYLHLSKFKVAVGDHVSQGEVVGLSGATGRVEAPHLHWEMSWKGIPVNPIRFLRVSERTCDRE